MARATRGFEAAKELVTDLDLQANTPDAIGTDLFRLIGRPEDPTAVPPIAAIVGKHPTYTEARAAHALARVNYRTALQDARDYMANAVDTLKGKLGRRWNSQWTAVGFTNGSLALPANPVTVLGLIATYYRAHAAHEVASEGLTATNTELKKSTLVAAQSAVDAAHTAEAAAKQARDTAFQKLRRRIGLLREELETLLSVDDPRWYRFGFRRPSDGQTPDLVAELKLRVGGAGEVIAEWSKARLAVNYRVSWKLAGSTDEPTEVGLFADQQTVITGLAPGTTITIIVTARNDAGESAPMEAQIAVP